MNSPSFSHPFLFAGAGLLEWTAGKDFTGHWENAGSISVRYMAGVGYEFILKQKFGVAAEVAIGNLRTKPTTGEIKHSVAIGVGLHYYKQR